MPDPEPRITPVKPADFAAVADLARRIWTACFVPIIGVAQCEHMLRQRYSPEAMSQAIRDGMRYELLHLGEAIVGFGAHGPDAPGPTWKLWQVYVLPEHQGQGLGRRYIEHVARAATQANASTLILTVNKQNHAARRLYERAGFRIREAVAVPIGDGFVMDDYVMERDLRSPS